MNLEQVKDYWSDKISSECYDEGAAENDGYYFDIMSFKCVENGSPKMGTPDFVAHFDKKGKCYYSATKFKIGNGSIVDSKLKKLGFKFDSNKKLWVNPSVPYTFSTAPIASFNGVVMGDDFLLMCDKR